jgi:hypothetical protein
MYRLLPRILGLMQNPPRMFFQILGASSQIFTGSRQLPEVSKGNPCNHEQIVIVRKGRGNVEDLS